jgi:hypothetical protein
MAGSHCTDDFDTLTVWPEHWTRLAVNSGMGWDWFAAPFCTLDRCFAVCPTYPKMLWTLVLLQERMEAAAVARGYAAGTRRWVGGPCQEALTQQLAVMNNPYRYLERAV